MRDSPCPDGRLESSLLADAAAITGEGSITIYLLQLSSKEDAYASGLFSWLKR
jgi:hypothetical protein